MASQLEHRVALAVARGLAGMLGPVKHKDVCGGALGGDEVRVVWRVACSVDLTVVIDLLDHIDMTYALQQGSNCVRA